MTNTYLHHHAPPWCQQPFHTPQNKCNCKKVTLKIRTFEGSVWKTKHIGPRVKLRMPSSQTRGLVDSLALSRVAHFVKLAQ